MHENTSLKRSNFVHMDHVLDPPPPCGPTWTIERPHSPLPVHVVYECRLYILLKKTNIIRIIYEFKFFVLKLHTAKVSTPIKMIERSLWSARHVFGKNLMETGKMAQSEFEVLNSWFEFLKSCPNVNLGVDLVVYLRTSPEVAYERLRARSRSEEKVVSIDYLKELHDLHEKWLITNKDKCLYGGADVVVIDADQDLNEVPDLYAAHKDKILSTLKDKKHPSLKRLCLNSTSKKQPLSDLSNLEKVIA